MENRKRDQIIIITVVSIALLLVVSLWIRSKLIPEKVSESRPISVSTVSPALADLQEKLTLSSLLEAGVTVTVIPKVAGTILNIAAAEGDMVVKGDVLARIDSEPYLLELGAAESAWRLSESSLYRIERMHQSSGASLQQLDEARAGRDAALSSYEMAKMRFGYSEIRSPISGQVLRRFADTGNLASPEQALFLVADTSHPRVSVRIPEKYWLRFKSPESIDAFVIFPGGGGTEQAASFERIGPSISPEGKTFEVVFNLPAEQQSWPMGATVDVEIILSQKKNTWSLPMRSLSGDGSIWIVDSDSLTVNRIEISDIYSDGKRFAIPEELSGGIFVLDGHHRLSEGQIVQPFGTGA